MCCNVCCSVCCGVCCGVEKVMALIKRDRERKDNREGACVCMCLFVGERARER